ncbi:alpha/beta hydrolase [Herbiconiux sp. CPCC 205763]|uniref:Alpha/beta hydrolase n=1 Tax=Herbiconiux aconitum TaxID=2970913 RepID=A0ABT2GQQ7_9MICO|nr:alpha/beta hydrolase [Herbiconiux aconitum]MCS5717106.1 alpha/beta hydrolase [Herbiconiux aconitum]
MNATDHTSILRHLDRGEGRLAYGLAGSGPLVVTSPGMGDLRSTYRELSPQLVNAGFRVADAELRGHGDSDATFSSYGDSETADDLIALIDELGGPAVIVGNSMSAGSAVLVAARRPDLVAGLVLVGPFVRNPPMNPLLGGLFRVMMARPWAAAVWNAYLPSLYAGQKPADFAEYRASVRTEMRRPGRAAAFSRTTRTSHAEAEQRVGSVVAPALLVMGESDPDFRDPAGEARWIESQFARPGQAGAEIVMVPDAGHYPHAQRPEIVTPAVLAFVTGLPLAANGGFERA